MEKQYVYNTLIQVKHIERRYLTFINQCEGYKVVISYHRLKKKLIYTNVKMNLFCNLDVRM